MTTFRVHYLIDLKEKLFADIEAEAPDEARDILVRRVREQYAGNEYSLHVSKIKRLRG